MRIPFTKMQGAGNDFVVLDETERRLALSTAQYRWLADRHFGVGADQILSVRPAPDASVDFAYVIHNADGGEVEHCGNGARCFARFVRERGLTHKALIRVRVAGGDIELRLRPDGHVTVDMGAPVFDLARVPFDPAQAGPVTSDVEDLIKKWPLSLAADRGEATVYVAVLSMGNPHAVLFVDGDVEQAPVARIGPLIERHPAFARGVNAGFAQVTGRSRLNLRVWERGAGETLACGTGACAAVVAGIRLGLLDAAVQVRMRGGELGIEWAGGTSPVRMTGPAVTVFEGSVELPPDGG